MLLLLFASKLSLKNKTFNIVTCLYKQFAKTDIHQFAYRHGSFTFKCAYKYIIIIIMTFIKERTH